MSRWRDIKQGKTPKEKVSKKPKTTSQTLPFASLLDRLKAFLTDTFMLMMPVMYIIIYLVMGNLQNAGEQKLISWGYILTILGVIVVAFYARSGQTPGLKAYDLKVIDIQTQQKPTILSAFLRYLFFNITFFTLIGLFVPLFRKDKRSLYDLLSGTAIIVDKK